MKKYLLLLLATAGMFAQNPTRNAGGFTTQTTMDASAIAQFQSTTKGILTPRMTTTQKNAIASPATGLLVFDTTLNSYSFYDGTNWTAFGGSGGEQDLQSVIGFGYYAQNGEDSENAVSLGIKPFDFQGFQHISTLPQREIETEEGLETFPKQQSQINNYAGSVGMSSVIVLNEGEADVEIDENIFQAQLNTGSEPDGLVWSRRVTVDDSKRTKVNITPPSHDTKISIPAPSANGNYFLGKSVNGLPFDSTGNVEVPTGGGGITNVVQGDNIIVTDDAGGVKKVAVKGYNIVRTRTANGLVSNILAESDDPIDMGIALMQTIADSESGDLITVYNGVYEAHDLLKDGVNLHFEDGAIVQYTGSTGGINIFDDRNTAITASVTGYGVFLNNSTGNDQNGIIINNSGSKIYIQAKELYSKGRALAMYKGTLNLRVDYIHSVDGAVDMINGSNGDAFLTVNSKKILSETNYAIEHDGGAANIYANEVISEGGNAITMASGSGSVLVEASFINSVTECVAIGTTDGSVLTIKNATLSNSSGNLYYGVLPSSLLFDNCRNATGGYILSGDGNATFLDRAYPDSKIVNFINNNDTTHAPNGDVVFDALALKVDKDGTKVLSDVNFSTAKDTKLAGIATGATANQTDAYLLDRAHHTGTQPQSTVTNLVSDLADINANTIKWPFTSNTPTTLNTSTSSGVSTLPVFYAIPIPANSTKDGSRIDVSAILRHTGNVATAMGRMYINTTPLLSTGTPIQVATYTIPAAVKSTPLKRTLRVSGTTLILYDPTQSAATDDAPLTADYTTVSFDKTILNYLIFTGYPSNASDSVGGLAADMGVLTK